jgi:hypothetical protein
VVFSYNYSTIYFNVDISNNTWKPSSLAVKINIGLGNADNTSDANKPVSSAQCIKLKSKFG